MINVEVQKNGNENNVSLIKRFTRKVQGSGVLPRIRSIRYKLRDGSTYSRKKRALKYIERKKEVEGLIKMGKMVDKLKR